jgi:hypothetical protein
LTVFPDKRMKVRPFDWRDIPTLHRYRNHCLFLDSIRILTQGPRLVPVGALISYFALTSGIFTYQGRESNGSHTILIGQVIHPSGSPSAHLSFLTPVDALDSPALPALLERATKEVGQRGANHLLADVEEDDPVFEPLRKAGFVIFARQRIWKLNGKPAARKPSSNEPNAGDSARDNAPVEDRSDGSAKLEAVLTPWKTGNSRDLIGVRSLYCNLVPGLVQQIEPSPTGRPQGLVYRDGSDVLAYVEMKSGPHGIWMQPFIHPDMDNVPGRLANLLQNLVFRRSRPVYLCVRSYQSWLESAVEDLGAEAGPCQIVMVKRLALPLRANHRYALPALERSQSEVPAPLTQSKSN